MGTLNIADINSKLQQVDIYTKQLLDEVEHDIMNY